MIRSSQAIQTTLRKLSPDKLDKLMHSPVRYELSCSSTLLVVLLSSSSFIDFGNILAVLILLAEKHNRTHSCWSYNILDLESSSTTRTNRDCAVYHVTICRFSDHVEHIYIYIIL